MFLGIDLGTHSVKALLLNAAGQVVGEGRAAYPVLAPQPGWSETDPEAWWGGVVGAVRAAVGPHEQAVAALGLSGQMHGVVLASAQGEALRPAVLWADARATAELAAFRALPERAQDALANPFAVGMAGPTLLWLKAHEAASYRAARWALQPKDWLRARLTGCVATDPSDASGTLLYDIAGDAWAEEVVAALGLRRALLPEVSPSGSVAGTLTPAAAAALGLPAGLPVATGAADTAAAALGSGLHRAGDAQLSVGSGAQLVSVSAAPTGAPERGVHLYRTALAAGEPGYYLMAAVQNAGLALEWVLGVLGLSWEAAYELAGEVAPGGDGLLFLPYLTGERTPHLNPEACGSWHGFRRFHTRGHLMRSALEGVAFAIRDALGALSEAGVTPRELWLAGGSARVGAWRQLLAEVLGRELKLSEVADASARGAALLAARAVGVSIPLPGSSPVSVVTPTAPGAYDEPYAAFRELYTRLYR